MGLDVLLSRDGRPHVTELQTIWGYTGDAKGLRPYGQLYAGRYKYNADMMIGSMSPASSTKTFAVISASSISSANSLRRPASARVTR